MTHRERREAKAERLREWAGKREDRAATADAAARQIADMIPFGQPILIGHHSEGRARRDAARIESGFRRSFEHATKASEMTQRAANIEAAAERSIYSDDPDAIERLTERIAELEVKRDQIKAANAAYRKEHKAELAALTAFGRDRALPHPSYELTNLTSNIKRNRDRLADLLRKAP